MELNRILAIAFGLTLIALVAYVALMAMAPPSNLDLSRDKSTVKGLYKVAVAPETAPFDRAVMHSWIATVATAQGQPVADANITVNGGMPEHGHGLPTAPAVTGELGEGRYRIDGVRFNMGGWWEFKLHIKAAAGEDDVTFNLDL